ncbi:MAG: hypothetical protein JNK92_13665 [Dechloromonas sp.]|nr:hypothetical protein [Dechloromonas sp.]
MSFALVELKRLLVSGDTLVGAVMGIEGTRISVATHAGAMTVQALDTVAIGDRVLIRNGQARRAPSARQSYPV